MTKCFETINLKKTSTAKLTCLFRRKLTYNTCNDMATQQWQISSFSSHCQRSPNTTGITCLSITIFHSHFFLHISVLRSPLALIVIYMCIHGIFILFNVVPVSVSGSTWLQICGVSVDTYACSGIVMQYHAWPVIVCISDNTLILFVSVPEHWVNSNLLVLKHWYFRCLTVHHIDLW